MALRSLAESSKRSTLRLLTIPLRPHWPRGSNEHIEVLRCVNDLSVDRVHLRVGGHVPDDACRLIAYHAESTREVAPDAQRCQAAEPEVRGLPSYADAPAL